MKEKNKKHSNYGVQLITYPDSLGKDLSDLKDVLDRYFKSAISGVHILPFYPASGDRGFAPLTHRQIDSRFGTFEDVKNICQDYDVMVDLIVNHVSIESKYFQDFLENGKRSKYRHFFIEARHFSRRWYKKPSNRIGQMFFYFVGSVSTFLRNIDFIFHKHGVNKMILKKIYRPRPGSPFIKFKRKDGHSRYLWCTFGPKQVDLNIDSQAVRRKFRRDIRYLESLGVKFIRLDAVAYTGKKRGTNNFLIPKTKLFIKWLAKHSHNHNLLVVPEIHFHYRAQLALTKIDGVDHVYDFCLPFLLLHAIYHQNVDYLKKWFKIRPDNSISILDTHDGLGVIDVEGLLPEKEIDDTIELIYKNGGSASKQATGNSAHNNDVYQVNCTYYSALAEEDKAYLLARAIQIFLPGIVQIYYVGLLAGKNDKQLLDKTGIGRNINRHYYSKEEVKQETSRKIVKQILKLCELRNNHPAFRGSFELENSSEQEIKINWRHKKNKLSLSANLVTKEIIILDNGKRFF